MLKKRKKVVAKKYIFSLYKRIKILIPSSFNFNNLKFNNTKILNYLLLFN